jgi:hypothetical protein
VYLWDTLTEEEKKTCNEQLERTKDWVVWCKFRTEIDDTTSAMRQGKVVFCSCQQESDKGDGGENVREQGQKRIATERLKDQGLVEKRLCGDEGKCVTHDVRHASGPSSRSKTDSRTQGSTDGDSKQR